MNSFVALPFIFSLLGACFGQLVMVVGMAATTVGAAAVTGDVGPSHSCGGGFAAPPSVEKFAFCQLVGAWSAMKSDNELDVMGMEKRRAAWIDRCKCVCDGRRIVD